MSAQLFALRASSPAYARWKASEGSSSSLDELLQQLSEGREASTLQHQSPADKQLAIRELLRKAGETGLLLS